eukprot:gene33921-41841_t
MATAMVSKPWVAYFLWVAMISGISATQVVQLVAQKLTSVTLPRRSAVDWREPSSSTNVLSGAAERPVSRYT